MADVPPLTDLLNRALRAGDKEAQNELAKEPVLSWLKAEIAKRFPHRSALAGKFSPSDVLQEIFCDLTPPEPTGAESDENPKGRSETKPVENGRAYLSGCVRNRIKQQLRACLSHKRNAGLEVQGDEMVERLATRSPTPLEALIQADALSLVNEAISELQSADCAIINQKISHPNEEWAKIAETAGLTADAAKKRYQRAIECLRKRFASDDK